MQLFTYLPLRDSASLKCSCHHQSLHKPVYNSPNWLQMLLYLVFVQFFLIIPLSLLLPLLQNALKCVASESFLP